MKQAFTGADVIVIPAGIPRTSNTLGEPLAEAAH
jgi:malate/lactate dehydrogenase